MLAPNADEVTMAETMPVAKACATSEDLTNTGWAPNNSAICDPIRL